MPVAGYCKLCVPLQTYLCPFCRKIIMVTITDDDNDHDDFANKDTKEDTICYYQS